MTHTLFPPYVFGTKITGRGHLIKGTPCQDAYNYEISAPSHIIIAVADGLGSAARSDLGAQCAVESAVNAVTELMAKGETDKPLLVQEGVKSARQSIIECAAREICRVRDLACTILLIIASEDGIAVGHIGDGAVVMMGSGKIRIFSEPENSEYANVVVPITSDEWEAALRIRTSEEPIECVAAFTDGLQNAALHREKGSHVPFNAFFNPLFSYAIHTEDTVAAEDDIHELLQSAKIRGSSDDDMTLVIGVLNTNRVREKS